MTEDLPLPTYMATIVTSESHILSYQNPKPQANYNYLTVG